MVALSIVAFSYYGCDSFFKMIIFIFQNVDLVSKIYIIFCINMRARIRCKLKFARRYKYILGIAWLIFIYMFQICRINCIYVFRFYFFIINNYYCYYCIVCAFLNLILVDWFYEPLFCIWFMLIFIDIYYKVLLKC